MRHEFPLYVRKEVARRANAEHKTFCYDVDNIYIYPIGRALCQYLLENLPVPSDPFEEALDAAFESTKHLSDTRSNRQKFAATLRAELEARGLLEEVN